MRASFCRSSRRCLTQTIEPRRRTALFARYSVIGSLAGALGVLAAAFPISITAWTGFDPDQRDQLDVRPLCDAGVAGDALVPPAVPRGRGGGRGAEGAAAAIEDGWSTAWRLCSAWIRSAPAFWCSRCWRSGCIRPLQVSVTTAAAILFWSSVCSAVSYLVAVPIAERIGLINTMVFTHLPSNVFLIADSVRTRSDDSGRFAAGAQRVVADGRADAGLVRHGGGHVRRSGRLRRASPRFPRPLPGPRVR